MEGFDFRVQDLTGLHAMKGTMLPGSKAFYFRRQIFEAKHTHNTLRGIVQTGLFEHYHALGVKAARLYMTRKGEKIYPDPVDLGPQATDIASVLPAFQMLGAGIVVCLVVFVVEFVCGKSTGRKNKVASYVFE